MIRPIKANTNSTKISLQNISITFEQALNKQHLFTVATVFIFVHLQIWSKPALFFSWVSIKLCPSFALAIVFSDWVFSSLSPCWKWKEILGFKNPQNVFKNVTMEINFELFKMQPIYKCPRGEKCFCSNWQTVKTRELQKSSLGIFTLLKLFHLLTNEHCGNITDSKDSKFSKSANFQDTIQWINNKQHSRCVDQFF